jgi:hypothetical protein
MQHTFQGAAEALRAADSLPDGSPAQACYLTRAAVADVRDSSLLPPSVLRGTAAVKAFAFQHTCWAVQQLHGVKMTNQQRLRVHISVGSAAGVFPKFILGNTTNLAAALAIHDAVSCALVVLLPTSGPDLLDGLPKLEWYKQSLNFPGFAPKLRCCTHANGNNCFAGCSLADHTVTAAFIFGWRMQHDEGMLRSLVALAVELICTQTAYVLRSLPSDLKMRRCAVRTQHQSSVLTTEFIEAALQRRVACGHENRPARWPWVMMVCVSACVWQHVWMQPLVACATCHRFISMLSLGFACTKIVCTKIRRAAEVCVPALCRAACAATASSQVSSDHQGPRRLCGSCSCIGQTSGVLS